MRLSLIAVAMCLAWLAGMTSAEARTYHGHKGDRYERSYKHSASKRQYSARYASRSRSVHRQYSNRKTGSGYAYRSGARRHYANSGSGGRHYAQRRSYSGRPSGPQIGAVVVWPHHVGMITGRAANGQWIVKSGNDGNAVRERARSVAGAVFRVG